MGIVLVDGKEIEIAPGERLNGIQAAERAGIDIPRYCWHPGLTVVASCRMCLVETGTRNAETGAITMLPKLVPACQTPANDNTVFVTNSEKVEQSRAMVEEDLLIDHPIDCPICDKAGECYLQDYHFKYGQDQRRADVRPFTSRRREMGDTVTLFVDRCVMCTRCVRFTREISGTSELLVINRGNHEEIDVFPGYPLENKMSGNVVDLCPVGALGDKDFLYTQRVWFMKSHPGICTGCATGCSINVEENQDTVYRLKPRTNPHVNQWWMCDEGRYGYHHVHSDRRLTNVERRDGAQRTILEWSQVLREIDERFRAVGRIGASLSPHLTVEEAYLLAKYARQIDPQALIVVGPIPMEGQDETFKNGFTIRAEKCPNRRGVEEIVSHFMGRIAAFDELTAAVQAGEVRGAWISGGYKHDWIDRESAERLATAECLVVQDLFESPLMERATYRLPGAAFAEREGCYVNFADRLQAVEWAVRPPVGVHVEAGVYWELLGMAGLFKARRALDELAGDVPFFSRAAEGVDPLGVDLKAEAAAEAATAS
ncbi:MAG TPA: 2Fe-2S iron-sulfur cluster-binding protein [Pirellulales bacterium]|jgi:NADH-quinone oxidoreductase subunit G|nr:2Fe-2S iron-sulfur cluster-binding protein [Pirellulales bacterium]